MTWSNISVCRAKAGDDRSDLIRCDKVGETGARNNRNLRICIVLYGSVIVNTCSVQNSR